MFANNQKVTAYWERIAEKYNVAKPAYAYKRHREEQLRKHWDQIKKQVNLFAGEYDKCEREQSSDESLSDVRDKWCNRTCHCTANSSTTSPGRS